MEILTQVQGKHGTEVNVRAYKEMLQQRFEGCEIEGAVRLHLYPVHVPRRRRQPGIYATAYNFKARNSIEALFFEGDATGRPGLLHLSNEDAMGKALKALSSRLHAKWSAALAEEKACGFSAVGKSNMKLGRALLSANAGAHRQVELETFRQIIREDREAIAYRLVQCDDSLDLLRKIKRSASRQEVENGGKLFVEVLEQFGLLEYNSAAPEGTQCVVSEYAYDLANRYIERLNAESFKTWRNRADALERSCSRAEEDVERLTKQLQLAEASLRTSQQACMEHEGAKPRPIPLLA